MSEFKGTPGKWLNDDHLVYALDETGGVNRFSCMMQPGFVYHGRTVKEPIKIDELTANARLIAASPDLLEAAQHALNFIENTESEMGETLNSGDVLRAAIEKALQP